MNITKRTFKNIFTTVIRRVSAQNTSTFLLIDDTLEKRFWIWNLSKAQNCACAVKSKYTNKTGLRIQLLPETSVQTALSLQGWTNFSHWAGAFHRLLETQHGSRNNWVIYWLMSYFKKNSFNSRLIPVILIKKLDNSKLINQINLDKSKSVL